jgi:BirA family biotin operon repressor/biotin-[acetyl-CoA-carboxylase] ligase
MGAEMLWFDQVESTNDVGLRLGEAGAAHGLVVAADSQSRGRGRLGRQWDSPRGGGLYLSVLLKPLVAGPVLTLAIGVAVAEGIGKATGLTVELKWPNDVLAGERKLAGILTEVGVAPEGARFAVAGIGINVVPVRHPRDVAARATSLEAELGRPVDRGLVCAEVLVALRRVYEALSTGRVPAVLSTWRQLAHRTLRRRVAWEEGSHHRQGLAVDIDDDGALLVEGEGATRRVIAGEVRWT